MVYSKHTILKNTNFEIRAKQLFQHCGRVDITQVPASKAYVKE